MNIRHTITQYPWNPSFELRSGTSVRKVSVSKCMPEIVVRWRTILGFPAKPVFNVRGENCKISHCHMNLSGANGIAIQITPCDR